MKLADALRGLSERALRPYRVLAGRPADDPLPPAQLAALLTAPDAVRARLARLDPPTMTALRIIWYQGDGVGPWARATVFQRLHPQGRLDQALRTLQEQALVLPTLSAGGGVVPPEELFSILDEISATEWLAESGFLAKAEDVPETPAAVDPAVVVADFARFLGGLTGSIRVRAADHVPYQTDQRALVAAMDRANREEFPPFRRYGVPWSGYARELGAAFACAISYSLLEGHHGRWHIRPAAVAEFMALPPLVQWAAILQAWMFSTVRRNNRPASAILEATVPPGVWCWPRRRLRLYLGYRTPDPTAELDATQNAILAVGIELGAFEHGALDGEDWLIRLRPEAVAALRWMEGEAATPPPFPAFDEVPLVQGTFEVLVGPRVPPQDVWVLEQWAERAQMDRFATYRLTRATVTAAARRGADAATLLAVLGRSPGGVPQNVAYSLREWTGSIVRAQATVGIVLQVPDDAAADRLAPVLARQERLGPRAWLIGSDALSQVWKAAAAAGCEILGDPEALRLQLRPVERPHATPVRIAWPVPAPLELPKPAPIPAYAERETPPPSR